MSQLTESVAEQLAQPQAAALARVIDLQARWENLRDKPGKPASEYTTPDLHGRQKAYDAFRAARGEYESKYRSAGITETMLNTPERVGAWCRAVRAVFRKAGDGEFPAAAMDKAHRLADRIAARLQLPAVPRAGTANLADAVRGLDAIVSWCDGLLRPAITSEAA